MHYVKADIDRFNEAVQMFPVFTRIINTMRFDTDEEDVADEILNHLELLIERLIQESGNLTVSDNIFDLSITIAIISLIVKNINICIDHLIIIFNGTSIQPVIANCKASFLILDIYIDIIINNLES